MNSSSYLSLYVGLWVLTLIGYILKNRTLGSTLGGYLILLYGMSGAVSIWVVNQVNYWHSSLYKYDIDSFLPPLYLWACVLLFSTPLFFTKLNNIKKICISPSLQDTEIKSIGLYILSGIFIVASVVVLYVIVPMLLNVNEVWKMDSNFFKKEEFQSDNNAIIFLNPVISKCYNLWWMFKDLMLCIAFYMGLVKEKVYIACVIFFFSAILPILYGIANCNRQLIICSCITIFITYQLFKNLFNKKTKRILIKIGIVTFLLLSVPILLISILRFGSNFNILVYEILRYFGEPVLNFSSWLFFHVDGQNNGSQILSGLSKDAFFYKTVQTLGPYFYTFVGDLIIAWGHLAIIIIAVLFAVWNIWTRFFKMTHDKISLGKLILLQTLAIMCFEGLFSFIHWLNIKSFLWAPVFFLFLNISWMKIILACKSFLRIK